MTKLTIAIDGLSGCGKSSTAKEVARMMNYVYIDSGAMYRAVTLYLLRHEIDAKNVPAIIEALSQIEIAFTMIGGKNETLLNGENVEDDIRSMAVSEMVSQVSTVPQVRSAMVAQQQQLGRGRGVVMDGRDIGTVVFPDAELKIFMSADLKIRALRRKQELHERGVELSLEQIESNLAKRDAIDSSRSESPLIKATDALEIDTSHMSFEQQVGEVVNAARGKIAEIHKNSV